MFSLAKRSTNPAKVRTVLNLGITALAAATLIACGGGTDTTSAATGTTPPLTAPAALTPLDQLFAANSVISIPGPVKETVSLNWRDTLAAWLANATAEDKARLPGLSVTIQTQGSSGTLILAGDVLSYQPKADKQGTDSGTLTITDGVTTRTVTVNIAGINTLDTTPDAYSLSPQSGVPTATTITSNEITVTGLSPATPVAAVITGDATSQISLDSGTTWIAMGTAVTVQNGTKIQVRHRTPATGGAQTTTTLAIAGVASTFVTTTFSDAMPDAWNLGQTTGVARGSVQNKTITIGGINVSVPFTVSGGVSYSIDGGTTYSTAPTTVNPGQVVQLRMAASGAYASTVTGHVTAGGSTEPWAVSTMAEPNTAPVLPTIAPITLVEGTAGAFTLPPATDANGNRISYTTGTLPAGFSFDPVTRTLSWTTAVNAGTSSFTYTGTDDGSPALSTTVTVGLSIAARDTPTTYRQISYTQTDGTSGDSVLVIDAGIRDADDIQAGSTQIEILSENGGTVIQQKTAPATGGTAFTGLNPGNYVIASSAMVWNKQTQQWVRVVNPNRATFTVTAVVTPPPDVTPPPCPGITLPDGTCF